MTASVSNATTRWINVVGVIFLTYTIATFDRTNLALALPDMSRDLDLTPTQAGFAGGIFSWGYVLTFMAAGWLAPRFGPRRLITVCLACWGAAAILSGFAHSFASLLVIRLLLGFAEGPVWTAAAMLTAQFFVKAERGRAFALWTLSAPLGALVAGPVSGMLLAHYDWRMMLIIEGVPAWLWAIVWYWRIPASLESARWLTDEERSSLKSALYAEQQAIGESDGGTIGTMLSEPIVWYLLFGFSLINLLVNGFTLWLPSAIHAASTYSMLGVGFLSALPWIADMLGIFLISRRSDRRQERRLHAAVPMMITGMLLLLGANTGSGNFWIQMLLFTLSGFFVHMFLPLIFTYTTEVLPERTAIPAVAFIGGVGNLVGGFIGPLVVGLLRSYSHDFRLAFSFLAVCGIVGGLLVLRAVRQTEDRVFV